MLRQRVVLALAVLANALGWVLPVIDKYRGWQAFRVALSPLWPYERFHIDDAKLEILSVASAATNVLFAVVAVWLAFGRGAGPRARIALWAAAAATLLNLHWPISMGDSAPGLRAGYFVWVVSFALLTLAAFLADKRRQGLG
jgi:hypothetical protein